MATRKQIGWTVPGFGLPLRWPEVLHRGWQDWPDADTLLHSALDGSESPNDCYTVRERTMLALMNELTDVPGWDQNIFDTNFTFTWKSAKVMSGRDVTKAMANWCVEEVKDYVSEFRRSEIIPAIDGGVVKSDTRIPVLLHRELERLTRRLRKTKSWELRPPTIISDVVDPFLFAFSWENTRTVHFSSSELTLSNCIERSGDGEVARPPSEDECPETERPKYPNDQAWSRRFQFLPFEVKFDNKGEGGSRITSYINDVHPYDHKSFYNAVENIVDATIPMFNRTLIESKAPGFENVRLHVADLLREPMIKKDVDDYQPAEQRAYKTWLNPQGRWRDSIFVDLKKEFWNVGLQMVLHVQDINLTPEQPRFEGEDWHVQGQRNERICATASYVYSARNTTPAQISFRKRVHVEEAGLTRGYIYEPPFAPEIYGAQDGDPVIQHMGDINVPEGRLVTYPNMFQTRLLSFELVDKTKLGHFKLFTLHLIDPQRRMMSSAMVPPQRRDWWAAEVRRKNARLRRLPGEIWDRIVENIEPYPIGMGKGEEISQEFRRERAAFQEKQTKGMEDYLTWDFSDPE